MIIRPATSGDAPAIGGLHIRAWQAAYRGPIPDTLLDGLDLGARIRSWEQILSPGGSQATTLVAETNGQIAGFCSIGPSRDGDAAAAIGDVWAIYVDPEHWRHGVGTQLFQYGLSLLSDRGASKATLWVLESNAPARRFYEKQGWWRDGDRKVDRRGEFELVEIRYRGCVVDRNAGAHAAPE